MRGVVGCHLVGRDRHRRWRRAIASCRTPKVWRWEFVPP